uniref:Uncharacterized protein n=1 Tax=Gossypium raimondii TaxID=29730 RepID=A0A0D2RXD1_GOSRA|nr:hypothetical protein B456_012G040300 [Gossypium raimondii]
MVKAKHILQQKDNQFRTDGRKILAYHSYLIKEKDDEGIQLLKKIAEMDIEDFPFNILQQIRSTWENCHQNLSTIHHYGLSQKRWQPERKENHIPTTKFGNVEIIMMQTWK